ncbi:hypothetical protein [uncultured Aquimarina sp.]|uniref:hypothetical protein n=1 Tax=uncultured Aquimarina sp. TaxID=575652 RepID=UPI0026299275|nr:hypothetical protein [uncultured Aquimarina sp.]
MENTEQITKAINDFLESINKTELVAKEIIFETEKQEEKSSMGLRACKWVWDADLKKLVWRC